MATHNGMSSPIEKLPLELKDQICAHMASALHSALHHSSLPEDDPWIFTWTMPNRLSNDKIPPWTTELRPPDCQIIQKRLRALSLVSKAWSRPAQRALFAVIPISSAQCLMKLLRSLLLYPKNRRYTRCLIPIFSYECEKFFTSAVPVDYYETNGLVTMTNFVDHLGDILFTPIAEELPNARLLRINLIKRVLDPQLMSAQNRRMYVCRFRGVLNSALWSVVHISPFLSALHLRSVSKYYDSPFAYGEEMAYSRHFLEGGHPCFKTLSLNYHSFRRQKSSGRSRDFEKLEFDCWMTCISTIRYITLLGSPYALQGLAFSYSPSLNAVYKWLDSVVQLTSLRLLHGFDETVCDSWDNNAWDPPPQQDWNSILLRHKDTLEELVFDGYRGVRDCNYSGVEDQRNIARFGPTETLSCLPKLQKLAYLKLPLHFLVPQADPHFIDEETSRESLPSPSTAPEALALVEPSFPPSLKRLDIVVYQFLLDEERDGEMYPLRTITVKF